MINRTICYGVVRHWIIVLAIHFNTCVVSFAFIGKLQTYMLVDNNPVCR